MFNTHNAFRCVFCTVPAIAHESIEARDSQIAVGEMMAVLLTFWSIGSLLRGLKLECCIDDTNVCFVFQSCEQNNEAACFGQHGPQHTSHCTIGTDNLVARTRGFVVERGGCRISLMRPSSYCRSLGQKMERDHLSFLTT